MATGTLVQKDDGESKASGQQVQAWSYYGFTSAAKNTSTRGERTPLPCQPVGEVRYVVGWMADQMTRLNWRVLVDGEDQWTITLPGDKGQVSSRVPETVEGQDAPEASDIVAEASAKILDLIGWSEGIVRKVTTNLFVAGELDYLANADDTWKVVSVVNPKRKKLADEAVHKIRGLWPHPADDEQPDAPLFGVLPVLEELDWLSRLERSQSANRIGLRGLMGVADGISFANGGDFWTEFTNALGARMADPTDVSPMVVRGAQELIEPSGKGMKGLSWVIPDFPFDDKLGERIEKAIHRLAYGLPVPPEILLGMQAQSRATAFQVEENSYRAHIEPPAKLVAQIATDALALLLPDSKIEVEPDPTDLLARRHSVQDVKDAWDRGLVSAAYVREVLDIPESAAPTDEDLALLVMVMTKGAGETDPANATRDERLTAIIAMLAARETGSGDRPLPHFDGAVAASVGGPDDEAMPEPELLDLSDRLVAIDYGLRLELAGATAQAVERARERVGAQARSRAELRDAVPRDVPNSEVAHRLGVDTLKRSGVPVEDIVVDALAPLGRWWLRRVDEAYDELGELLGAEADPGFTTADRDLSRDLLIDVMTEHVLATLEAAEPRALPPGSTQRVLTVAGGDESAA